MEEVCLEYRVPMSVLISHVQAHRELGLQDLGAAVVEKHIARLHEVDPATKLGGTAAQWYVHFENSVLGVEKASMAPNSTRPNFRNCSATHRAEQPRPACHGCIAVPATCRRGPRVDETKHG